MIFSLDAAVRLHPSSVKPPVESARLRFAPPSPRKKAAARRAVMTLLFCALLAAPLCAFAATNRVGVLTANYSMSAGGSGQWYWDYYVGDVENGISDQDNVQLSISGQVKYAVLQSGTNLSIGNVLILICFQDECNYPGPCGDAAHTRAVSRQADQT
jgi:hypothetical protein